MDKNEFTKKAKELGLSNEVIADIIKDVENSPFKIDYETYLIPLAIND